MKDIQDLIFKENSREELLPGFSTDFPYISSRAHIDNYIGATVPWHWHNAVELFYIESGCLEYTTPLGKWVFPKGTGGFVNSNILHSTKVVQTSESNIQLLHLFDPLLISGNFQQRIAKKFILPLTSTQEIQVIPLFPDIPAHADILKRILHAFELCEDDIDYEISLREELTRIWFLLFQLVHKNLKESETSTSSSDSMKELMLFIHENYKHSITVDSLANQLHVSRRTCFRLFQENLHMTPSDYIKDVRLQAACQLLQHSSASITEIAQECHLGSSSYFCKSFREKFHITPTEFRKHWHNFAIVRHD